MTETRTVAVLGTGIMGAAMARNIARAGHVLRVWNRSREKAEPLAADGAHVAGSPAEAVEGADVVVTMLYDGAAALEVMRQAAPGLRAGAAWAQATTAGLEALPELAQFAAKHGLVFFDAPVLGTRQPAEEGKLTVIAAGPVAERDRVTPVFDAVGVRTVWAGEDGAQGGATRLKLVANSWVLAVTGAAGEALALAKGLGVGPEAFLDVVADGPLDMPYLRLKAGMIMEDRLTPASFAAETAAKDARLIVEAGERHGVRLDVAAASAERFRRVVGQGRGRQDMAAAYWASFDEAGTDASDGGASGQGPGASGQRPGASGRGQGTEGPGHEGQAS